VGAAGTNGGGANIQFGQGSRSSGAQNAVNYGYAQGGASATKAPAAGTNGGSSSLSTPGAPRFHATLHFLRRPSALHAQRLCCFCSTTIFYFYF